MSFVHSRMPSIDNESYLKPDIHRDIEGGRESWRSPNQASWDRARFWLRIWSTLLSLILLALSITGFAAPSGFSSFPVMGLPMSAAILSYDFTEYIVMCVRRRKTGIDAKVSLGFELILAASGIALTILLISFTVDSWRWHMYYDYEGSDSTGLPTANFVTNGRKWFGFSVTASILGVVLSVIHSVLFVRACVEVDRQRKAAARARKSTTSADVAHRQQFIPAVPEPSEGVMELENLDDVKRYDTNEKYFLVDKPTTPKK
ncbi:hypothetical protein F4804DRAFT_319501 [Jackrogersella minutella]|nr:hypothetical protein F4804DRAFT_319501 [Jackrogersella minutella]